MGCLIADFDSLAPLKGAVVVDATVDDDEPWPTRLLVNRLEAEGLEARVRYIRPLDGAGSGLFRTFAALPETDDALAGFCSKHGFLGVAAVVAHTADGRRVYGELLERWVQSRHALADAVALWDLLRDQDPVALEEFVRDRPRSRYWQSTSAEPVENWTGNTVQQGWQLWQQLIEGPQAMSARPAARIAMLPTRDRPLAPQVVSDTLLGAMFTQLMFSNGKDYRACPVCGRYFEVSPQVTRADRIYCDDACRARAYRARKPKPPKGN